MANSGVAAVTAERSTHLHLATRVRGDDLGCRSLHGVERFAVAELVRHLLEDYVVDSGATAAKRRLFHLDQLEFGYRFHYVTWLADVTQGFIDQTLFLMGL